MFVFTDASYTDNPKMSGYGFVIIDKKDNIYTQGGYTQKCENNNIAEAWAVEQALKFIDENFIIEYSGDETINIITDSKHVLKHLDDLRPNEYETEIFDNIRDLRYKYKVNFFHIKGHVHDDTKLSYYNNIADCIAKEHRLLGLERYNNYQRKLMKNIIKEKIKKGKK